MFVSELKNTKHEISVVGLFREFDACLIDIQSYRDYMSHTHNKTQDCGARDTEINHITLDANKEQKQLLHIRNHYANYANDDEYSHCYRYNAHIR